MTGVSINRQFTLNPTNSPLFLPKIQHHEPYSLLSKCEARCTITASGSFHCYLSWEQQLKRAQSVHNIVVALNEVFMRVNWMGRRHHGVCGAIRRALDETCHCKWRASGSPICHFFVVLLDVCISRRRFMVAMVPDGSRGCQNGERERGERENVARICVRVW
jgi:hypothetical protein